MRLWVVAILSRNSAGATSLKSPENTPPTDGDMTTESPSATANVSSAVLRSMSRATSVYAGSLHGIVTARTGRADSMAKPATAAKSAERKTFAPVAPSLMYR